MIRCIRDLASMKRDSRRDMALTYSELIKKILRNYSHEQHMKIGRFISRRKAKNLSTKFSQNTGDMNDFQILKFKKNHKTRYISLFLRTMAPLS